MVKRMRKPVRRLVRKSVRLGFEEQEVPGE